MGVTKWFTGDTIWYHDSAKSFLIDKIWFSDEAKPLLSDAKPFIANTIWFWDDTKRLVCGGEWLIGDSLFVGFGRWMSLTKKFGIYKRKMGHKGPLIKNKELF